MNYYFSALQLVFAASVSYYPIGCNGACPFGLTGIMIPQDDIHELIDFENKKSGLLRRLTAHSENPATDKRMEIIENRKRTLQEQCLTSGVYDAIDADIESLAATFTTDASRAHFLGGIVRLAAHDFLDYDPVGTFNMGPDGCIDMEHSANSGLTSDIWCSTCALTMLYEQNYSFISKADFWIIAANSVIRQTSINNGLNLKEGFMWGRTDSDSCVDSATRLPEASDCGQVEDVFLSRLGLTWTEAVALIGAHTLGRGDIGFSGHHGIWVDTDAESVVFDKRYFEELIRRAWIPRNDGTVNQDWTWGPPNGNSPRFMLNTDMCLLFDIGSNSNCCSNTEVPVLPDGRDPCRNLDQCDSYDVSDPRSDAASAVESFAFAGGRTINNDNNEPFYDAFAVAWGKATTNGWVDLQSLPQSCSTSDPPDDPPEECVDDSSFADSRGIVRNCSWVVQRRNKCDRYAQFCPKTCGVCGTTSMGNLFD